MDDEYIQLKDVPIYRPKNLERQITIKDTPQSPTRSSSPKPTISTQNLLEQLIDQFVNIVNQPNIAQQNIVNGIYQILLNIGWSIFSRNTQAVELDKSKIVKHQCIYFYQRLRKYFQQNKYDNLNALLQKLEKLQIEADDDQIEEQKIIFKKINTINSTNFINLNKQQSFEINEEQLKEIEIKDQKLKELQLKLSCKDNMIKDMTQGYLKDVQHMKELLFRKNDHQINMFDVQYFDSKEGFSEEQTNLLNQKIKTVSQQFETKYSELQSTVQHLQFENKQYINQIEKFKEKLKIQDTSIGLLAKVIQMDNNDPYLTWKSIQDLKGNAYFFQVFEIQKHTYGINYREIDKLMNQSKSQQREVAQYKESLQEQLSQFYERQINYNRELQEQICEKEQEIEKQKQNAQIVIEECLKQSRKQMDEALQHRKNEMLQQLFCQYNELQEVKANFDLYQLKMMFSRWSLINRMLKCLKNTRDQQILRQEVKEIVQGRKEYDDKIKDYKIKYKKKKNLLKNQYEELKQLYENDKYNQIYWEYKYLTQQKTEQNLLNEISLIQQQNNLFRDQQKQLTMKYQLICSHFQQLYKIFENKQITIEKIDKNTIKNFEYKITKQQDSDKEHFAQQLTKQQILQQQTFDRILNETMNRSKYTQTTIMNINHPLQNNILNYELIEKIMKLKLSLNEMSNKSTNTDIEFEQKRYYKTQDQEIQCLLDNFMHLSSSQHMKNTSMWLDQQRPMRTPSQLCLLEEISEQQEGQLNNNNNNNIKVVETEIINNDTQNYIVFQKNSLKFSKEDFKKKDNESQLLYDQNRLKINTPQTPLQASLRVKDQLEKITYLSSNKDQNVDQQQDIFQRLYKDSLNRKQRLQILKKNIETLDQFKWEQILQILQQSPLEQNRGLSQKSTKRPQMYYSKQREADLKFSDQERESNRRMSYNRTGTQKNNTFHVQRTHQIKKQNTTFDFTLNKNNIHKF